MALLWGLLALLLAASGQNQVLFLAVHHAAQLLPGVVWRGLSMFGEWPLVIAVLLWLVTREPARLPRYTLAVLLGIAAAIMLKAAFAMPRPPLVLPAGSVHLLDVLPGNGSFPSGHAIAVALLAGLWPQGGRGWSWGGLALVALVCLSRLAIGVHWPLDVLAGAAVGYAVAALAGRVPERALPGLHTLLNALLLLSAALAAWRLCLRVPNEAYAGYNLLVLLLAARAWRQNKNGA
ncbi:undecaprenyl-diphosphatase [Vogesella sp. LIG4]|nr:undecaprenyl-diphosphatase [Vogesella sp. LIG4]